jgi:peptidoglycan-associated lipoprotein
MKLTHLMLVLAAAGVLSACSSTKPADGADGQAGAQGTSGVMVDAYGANGANGMNGANGANGSGGRGGKAGETAGNDKLNDPKSILSKRSVYFGFDSAEVTSEYRPVVEAHASFLKDYTGRQIKIVGNTDLRGSREYNLGLGQRRAESVKSMLRVLGVPEARLEAVSYGKEKPRSTGSSEADFAQNRRADVVYNGE